MGWGRAHRRYTIVGAAAAVVTALVPCSAIATPPAPTLSPTSAPSRAATVVAVIDSGMSPYHFDFLADTMPAAAAELRRNLRRPPDRWLAGFPSPRRFSSYQPLSLTLPSSPGQSQAALHQQDQAQWSSIPTSTNDRVNYRWIPGTKVIGAVTFGAAAGDQPARAALTGTSDSFYGTGSSEHGMGSASVAVGNLNGACPECLLVFLKYSTEESAERALTWATRQPWIDVVTNSYGFGSSPTGRDRVYTGSTVAAAKQASTRGQTVFFSAGNGLENEFVAPTTTLLSSQEGPDWIVTVAATSAKGRDYLGTGKPADLAGIGSGYPSAYASSGAQDGTPFTGTSSATPQVAGTYAHALATIRRVEGWARAQYRDVIAAAPGCSRQACRLSATRLRTALMEGATPSHGGFTDPNDTAGTGQIGTADGRFATEGHGTYRGLLDGRPAYDRLVQQRIVRPALGAAPRPLRPAGEPDWFRVDSWCRQLIWGGWNGGAYVDDRRTPLPAPDAGWPFRTFLQAACPALRPAPATPADMEPS